MAGLDPILAALRAEPATVAPADLLRQPIAEARAATEARWAPWNASPPDAAALEPVELPRADGTMLRGLRVHPHDVAGGTILFLHGGGWTVGSIDTHRDLAVRLAVSARATLLSIDYRLAPEHPFPAPLDDVMWAIQSLSGPLVLAGDSAGASLALSASLLLRENRKRQIRGAALFYGCFTPAFDRPSMHDYGDGTYGLSADRMRTFWTYYLGHAPSEAEGVATPGWADLAGLPPMFIHAAGHDVLRDDSIALAERLGVAGCAATLDIEPGAVHGYLQMAARLPIARAAIDRAGAFLRRHLGDEAKAGIASCFDF